jgi:hypothetical protein
MPDPDPSAVMMAAVRMMTACVIAVRVITTCVVPASVMGIRNGRRSVSEGARGDGGGVPGGCTQRKALFQTVDGRAELSSPGHILSSPYT